MPSPPWKKARLSRMMSDHLHLKTHGGSLVDDTGFPSSLVDLFVKNRSRMEKSYSKKSYSKKSDSISEVESEESTASASASASPCGSSPVLGDLFGTESGCSVTSPSSPLDGLRSPCDSVYESNPMVESVDQEENDGETVGCEGRGAESRRRFWSWWWWMFKAFFAVVLAMAMAMTMVLATATEHISVGITVSAFSLLLMELFCKYLLKPWQSARKSQKDGDQTSSIESQSDEVQIEDHNCNADVADLKEAETPSPSPSPSPSPKPNIHSRLPSQEIRAMKSILSSPRFHKRSASDDMRTTKDLHAFKSFHLNWFVEEESKEDVKKEEPDHQSELDQISIPPDHNSVPNQTVHKSSSRKIKSKIKKLVKKLKRSKKERTDRRSEASCSGPPTESESFTSSIKFNKNNNQQIIHDESSISNQNV